jgi:hypothetical protein
VSDVVDNKAHHRFELAVDGHLAAASYKLDSDVITFIHTEVPPSLAVAASVQSWSRARWTRSAARG